MYSVLTFCSVHKFSLGVSKMLKDCILVYISSLSAAAVQGMSLLTVFSISLIAIRIDIRTKTVKVKFMKANISADLKRLYVSSGIGRLLERNDHGSTKFRVLTRSSFCR